MTKASIKHGSVVLVVSASVVFAIAVCGGRKQVSAPTASQAVTAAAAPSSPQSPVDSSVAPSPFDSGGYGL